jgi:hypothetical protein
MLVTAITVDSLGGGIEQNWRIRCSSTATTIVPAGMVKPGSSKF